MREPQDLGSFGRGPFQPHADHGIDSAIRAKRHAFSPQPIAQVPEQMERRRRQQSGWAADESRQAPAEQTGSGRLFKRGRLTQRKRITGSMAVPMIEAEIQGRSEIEHDGCGVIVLWPGRPAAFSSGRQERYSPPSLDS